MKTIIYCVSLEKGEKRLEELCNNVDIEITKRNRGSYARNILTGDSWQVVCVRENSKGYKWDFCEVDEDISLAVYRYIILPSGMHNGNGYERLVSFY